MNNNNNKGDVIVINISFYAFYLINNISYDALELRRKRTKLK
jgi:hypothetical protein